MTLIQIIVLALIQGLTEFLPVSSSAHLILGSRVFGWPDQGLAFDVATHLGTLMAVLFYFRRELTGMALCWFHPVRGEGDRQNRRLFICLTAASVATVFIGFLAYDLVAENLRDLRVIAWATLGFGALLWIADSVAGDDRKIEAIDIKGALLIGVIQGTLAGIGFAVVGIEAAVFWGAIMAVLSILPGIGAPLVWVPAVIYLFMSGQVVAGIGLLVWSGGVVGSIDNFLRPVLVGRDTKMPDLLILLSTLGGVALFGASGLVLGPILAALFLTVLAMYSRVFADWLNVDQSPANPPSQRAAVQLGETQQEDHI